MTNSHLSKKLVPSADSEQTWILRPQDLSECFKPREDTWYFPRVAGTFKERAGFHGCQMPEQLLARIIRSCSDQGELVLDPFSGSATTLTVAKKLGRRYLGFDLSPDYILYGRKRLDSIFPGDPLEGSAEPLLSAPKTRSGTSRSRKQHRNPLSSLVDADRSEVDAANSRNQLEMTKRGIKEAYARSYSGYSPDRVVADPELNEHFANECQKLGLLGNARFWNSLLFRLRKAGRLIEFPTTKRTSMSWEECDEFLFASEIALEAMLSGSAGSLDEILCDPILAKKFDELAGKFAPGFTPLRYRWAALKLRKQAKFARSRGSVLEAPPKLHTPITLDDLGPIEELPDAPGIYLVTADNDRRLYVGETVSLRQRLRANFCTQRSRQPWIDQGRSTVLSIEPFVTGSSSSQMLAWQSCLIGKYETLLNFRELRVAR